MTHSILVTGPTGTVGQHVVAALAERDVDIRMGARDPESITKDLANTGDIVEFDFKKPETWGPALSDVEGVFLVRPPEVDKSDIGSFVEAADRTGVAHLAYLSTLGADANVLIPHHWIENRIQATDIDYTLLRASFFMQNLLEVHRRDIVEYDEIFVPAGEGRTSFVDARDIGEAAATVVTDSGHVNRAYDLTGPEALSYGEVANIFSDVLDRSITYPDPSLWAFARRMRHRGHPLSFIALMCGIYTTARLGLAGRMTQDLRQLLGPEPRGLRAFVEDHADEFRPSQSTGRPTGNPDAGYVETRGPPVPDSVYKIINPVMAGLLRSPLHSLVSDSILLLTFTGAKSGDEYTTPVGYWVKDGNLIVTTQSPWWRNLRGGQPVSMHLRGHHREGIATPHPDPEDVAHYMKEYIDRNGTDAARRLGIVVRGDREPTLSELQAGVEGTVVIEIELTDTKPPLE